MSLKTRIARTIAGTLIVFAALVAVGLTAPADAPYAIRIRAIFLGIDVDVKVGTAHAHFKWSAIDLTAPTTNTPASLL